MPVSIVFQRVYQASHAAETAATQLEIWARFDPSGMLIGHCSLHIFAVLIGCVLHTGICDRQPLH